MQQYRVRKRQKTWYEQLIDAAISFGGILKEMALFLLSLGKAIIEIALILRRVLTTQKDWREAYR